MQLGYISLGQLGSVGVSWGQLGSVGVSWGQLGSTGSSGVKNNQKGSSQDRLELKWGLVGNVDWLGK